MNPPGAALIQAWFSPGWPTGAFAWSQGLERAVEDGDVVDVSTLREWITDVMSQGTGRSEAILLISAWRHPEDPGVAELAAALQPSAERAAETREQGAAFARVTSAAFGVDIAPAPLPVAVGRASRAHGLPARDAAARWLQGIAANLVSVGIRIIPIGETEAARLLASLIPLCEAVASAAEAADPEDLGGACFGADLASMLHELQRTRLFRS
ncbi:MAG: urease accessory UreF family protein [Paracoccaceae bacterium]